MSRLGVALRALEANRRVEGYRSLLRDTPVMVRGADLVVLNRLTRQHPAHTDDLTEIFLVAATAESRTYLSEDRLDMLCRPRDVLAPAHGISERAEWCAVAATGLVALLLLLVPGVVDAPADNPLPRYSTTQEE